MSESDQASVGQVLREAREAQAIRIEEVASRLRLMQRQIEAMESDDFGSLGQPVFARGFVRNYARLLGLSPDALLVRMEGLTAEPAAAVRQPEPPLQRSWMSSPWLILLLLGLLVLMVTPVAMYWWLNQGEDGPISTVSSTTQIDAVSLAAMAPAGVSAEATAPIDQAAADQPATTGPVTEPTPPVLAEASLGGVLHLEFGADAWVEIRDAGGQVLHSQLNTAGSSADIRAEPPFDLVIGNAEQVRMTYNGRPFDLKPFIKVAVARFRFEE